MKHTPGNWIGKATGCGDQGLIYEEESGRNVAVAYDDRDTALIAAAPELLACLKEVVAISDRKHNAWDRARAAIEAAGGGNNGTNKKSAATI